jgi:cell division protein FtsI (penicillin-binding protein 3)
VFKAIADNVYGAAIDSMRHLKDTTAPKNQFMITEKGNTGDIKKIYSIMNLPLQDVGEAQWMSASQNQQQITAEAVNINDGEVPSVTGMGLKDALFLLEESGLRVIVNGKGKVKSQSLTAGAKIIKNENITINLD